MPDQDETYSAAHWVRELQNSEKSFRKYHEESRKLLERYYLQKEDGSPDTKSYVNILHSTVETIRPAVFTQRPRVEAIRRFGDNDPIARLSAIVLQRCVSAALDLNDTDDPIEETLDAATTNMLVVGRGVLWVSKNTETEMGEDGQEIVSGYSTPIENIQLGYFLHSIRNTWSEVIRSGWVSRRVDMTRAEGIEMFGDEFKGLPKISHKDDQDGDNERSSDLVAVWEIWSATDKKVYWVHRQGAVILKVQKDPLGLTGFFPIPKPAYATCGRNLMPVPDFKMYSSEADEVERQSKRISDLTEELIPRGIYDAAASGIADLLRKKEAQWIPVDINEYASKGGIQNLVGYVDLSGIMEALISAYDARDRSLQRIDHISGIADILRGTSDPNETATAQNLKARYAGQRIDKRRRSIENLARGALVLKSEIMVEHYPPEYLREMSGFDQFPEIVELTEAIQESEAQGISWEGYTPDVAWNEVMETLSNDTSRSFKLDIETESTLASNSELEQQQRVEFMQASMDFLDRFAASSQIDPRIAPLAGEILKFGVKSFVKGRELESKFDEAISLVTEPPPQEEPSPEDLPPEELPPEEAPQPDPMEEQARSIKLQHENTKLEIARIEAAAKMAAAQNKGQSDQIELERKVTRLRAEQANLAEKLQDLESKRAVGSGLEALV